MVNARANLSILSVMLIGACTGLNSQPGTVPNLGGSSGAAGASKLTGVAGASGGVGGAKGIGTGGMAGTGTAGSAGGAAGAGKAGSGASGSGGGAGAVGGTAGTGSGGSTVSGSGGAAGAAGGKGGTGIGGGSTAGSGGGQGGVLGGGAGQGGAGTSGAGGQAGSPAVCSPACTAPTIVCSSGTCIAPPSCNGLQENCGASAANSCCNPLAVPGGSFDRSYDAVTATDSSNPATVGAFSLDQYEVTVGRFRTFVNAGGGSQASPPMVGSGTVAGATATGWSSAWTQQLAANKSALVAALNCNTTFGTWTNTAAGNETRPINCVTWYEAQAFCIWDGGRLPTEAEWNFVAAGGGDQQRVYPWSIPPTSQTITAAQASYYVNDTEQCYGDGVSGCTGADILNVGSKTGQSLWGHLDLSGNVSEWVYDYYALTYPNPCVDCIQATASTSRVIRGGGFATTAAGVTASARTSDDPLTRAPGDGFRCAYGH
jgi:formylglycine-generating enzyme